MYSSSASALTAIEAGPDSLFAPFVFVFFGFPDETPLGINLFTRSLRFFACSFSTLPRSLMNSATDFLDVRPDQPQIEKEMLDNFVKQIVMVFLGAAHWEEEPTQSLLSGLSKPK